jgi:LmbE family N-acetylglucosaminyl deacetylase
MKFLNSDRALILAPHPDDAEYSTAGTVLKYTGTHFDILCLTAGGDCDTTTLETDRLKEVTNAWSKATSSNFTLHFTDFTYLKGKGIDEWVSYTENKFNIDSYNYIITPSEQDSHFEHGIVSSLGAPLVRSNSCGIIQYKSPSTLDTWTPNLFVSIKEEFGTKMEMLRQFESQLHRPYFHQDVLNGFHTHFQCMKKGKGYVELYKIITAYE